MGVIRLCTFNQC